MDLPRPLAPVFLLAAASLALSGCFGVTFEDGVIACGEAGCPSGLSCGDDGFCYSNPEGDPDLPDPPVDDPQACAGAFTQDYCSAMPLLPAPPEIDGELDCGATLRSISSQHWLASGASVAPSDHAAEIAVAWRPNGVYVFAQVHEPELDPARSNDQVYEGDALEIYVDDDGAFSIAPRYDTEGTRQFVAAAPEWDEMSRRGDVYMDQNWVSGWDSSAFIAVPTSDGFAIEAFVNMDQLRMTPRELTLGDRIGFDLGINVSRDSAREMGSDDYLGQYFLNVANNGGSPWPFDNVEAFCTPQLTAP